MTDYAKGLQHAINILGREPLENDSETTFRYRVLQKMNFQLGLALLPEDERPVPNTGDL